VRALFSFFFFPMNNGLLTKLPHKKKHPKKTKKKKKKKKMSEQQPASSPPANRLYVGNIPWSTTVEELQALFADATSVEIPTVRVFVFVFCRRCCASFCFLYSGWLF
jgi:RNA recognition motif-containing protein